MKITRIKIKNYLQFQDLDIDLTYPKGHAKEGKALDKVCIIGQSGTGKTTLLNLVSHFAFQSEKNTQYLPHYGNNLELPNNSLIEGFFLNNGVSSIVQHPFPILDTKPQIDNIGDYRILHFGENYLDGFQNAIKGKLKITENQIQEMQGDSSNLPTNYHKYFHANNLDPLLDKFWNRIEDRSNQERDWLARIGKANLTGNHLINQLENDYKDWLTNNPSPINELAETLNPLLNKFNVKVNLDFDFDSTKTLDLLRFETLNGTSILTQNVSTGIKAIILAALIFHYYKPKDALILFDEPEHSLYPDAQIEFVRMLFKLSTNSQYIFATHSPLIVSEFEPWEIVELKHDFENGGVYRELYYPAEKENHVDNYFWNTKALRWDSILTRIFDLVTLGGEDRGKELKKLSKLDSEISGMNSPDAEKKGKIKSYNDLADKIDFWRASEPENPYETNREKPE